MSDETQRLHDVFLDLQRGLPRQGPGSEESTFKALSLCTGLPERLAILDIGCGPGRQTVALAQTLADSHITAVDLHPEYLDELKDHVQAARVADRIDRVAADMQALPFPSQRFDLIWAEGAAYIMGFEQALVAWRRWLKSGGCLAVSELVWLRSDPPAEVAEFFAREYPTMTDVETRVAALRTIGYEPLGHVTLPDSDWWADYYTPLEAKLPSLYDKYAGDEAALRLIETTRREIDLRRRFAEWYGYEILVGRSIESRVG
jgi:ubiquinone/menaquinone biosynthesis C-methylase UbiE